MRNNPLIKIRAATKDDLPIVLQFIFDLAKFEQLEDECHATEEQLEHYLFSKEKVASALIADQSIASSRGFFGMPGMMGGRPARINAMRGVSRPECGRPRRRG